MRTMLSKSKFIFLPLFILSVFFTSCDKDDPENEEPKETAKITNIEIGLNNNEIGTIGKDFHFNAEVLAATKIDSVGIKIVPRPDETYEKAWSFEKTWPQYQNVKNALIHEHFSIPADAVEGKYDFIIIVKDQNGTTLEEKRAITLYLAANLPVDPQLFSFYAGTVDNNYKILREIYNTANPDKTDLRISKDELLNARAAVSGLKGDGKAVIVLINKKHNHRPETLEAIDYSKVIVVDVAQHVGVPASGSFSTTTDRSTTPITLRKPKLKIGADIDNNTPAGNPIDGLKAWESGQYYLGIIYKNTTYNMGLFEYINLQIEY